MRAGAERSGWHPDGCHASRGAILIAHLSGDQKTALSTQALVVSECRSRRGSYIRGGAWPTRAISELQHHARVSASSVGVGGRRSYLFFIPLEDWSHARRGTQHPFPVVRLTGTRRGISSQLLQRRKHRLHLDADYSRQIGVDTNVLLKGGKKSCKGDADAVQPGDDPIAVKDALRICEEFA